MKVLFIGGTGNISSACSRLALERGYDLTLLHRGQTQRYPVPAGARVWHANARSLADVAPLLEGERFDAIVDWIAFSPEDIELDLRLFAGKTNQFVFISSASAYQTPPSFLPITESTPLCNPFWEYSRQKIACEERLLDAYRKDNFPITIVRPSHTYDTVIPVAVGNWNYTIPDRMLRGQRIIVHDAGTSLWTLTHADDFARGFVPLLGDPRAIGHAFHITSDEVLAWNAIYNTLAEALGVQANLVHIPSSFIARYSPSAGAGLLGDKAHHGVFDNTKIKRLVPDFAARIPWHVGVRRALSWFEADATRKAVNETESAWMDECLTAFARLSM